MNMHRMPIVFLTAIFTALMFGAGCAGAADKDKNAAKQDGAIRWDTPGGSPASAASSASAAGSQLDVEDDLQSMWDEMDRMHQSMLGAMNSGWGWSGGLGRMPRTSLYGTYGTEMHADVAETDKEYIVTCELPGVPKEAVQIDVDGGVLVVRAVRDAGTDRSGDEEGHKYHYRERSYGTTERRFRVGSGVDPKKIKAVLKDGVLTVRVPKSAERAAYKIPIEG